MKLQLKKGVTSKLIDVFVQDTTKTDGSGLTGLVFNSASLSAYYYREGAASAVSITLQTMTLGTWATGGFIVVDGTNMPGCYQLGLPDAALATGANSVIVILRGATSMVPVLLEIQLTDTDVNDAVRFGLTALPNAAAGATGGLDCTVQQGGTAQGGAATTITLAAGASATDNLYANLTLAIAGGTGAGQSRNIISYVGSTKIATVDQAWITNPDNTSVYQVTGRRVAPNGQVAMGTVAAASGNVVTLQTGLGANNVINGTTITIVAGTGVGQTRGILLYTDSTKVATVDKPWTVAPDTTSIYVIAGPTAAPQGVSTAGTAQAGGATTITLAAASASATDNFYAECSVQIVGGTGVGQFRPIVGYVGSTKVATVAWAWATNPDSTSIYVVGLNAFAGTNGVGAISTVASLTANADKTGYTVSTVTDKTGYALTAGERTATAAALLATALTEIAQAQPSATPALNDAIMLLYQALRNARSVTATLDSIKNSAGTVVCKSTLADDGTVFTRAKLVSGP